LLWRCASIVPIFVEDAVLVSSRNQSAAKEGINNEELKRFLENLNDEDLGKYKM
jgi:hypothetical protein